MFDVPDFKNIEHPTLNLEHQIETALNRRLILQIRDKPAARPFHTHENVNWHFYIFGIPILIGLVAAIYFRRTLASSAFPSLRRAQMLGFVTVLWMLSFGAVIVRNFGHKPFSLGQIFSCAAFVVFVGANVYQIWKLWPQANAERLNLRLRKKHPTFCWQGTLILLPLLALTGIGIASIIRERRMVEDEARARAKEILDQLSAQLVPWVAGEFTLFEAIGRYWQMQHKRASHWPGSQLQNSSVENRDHFSQRIIEWQTNFPNLDPAKVFPYQITFNPNGELSSPPPNNFPPSPPEWFQSLFDEQREIWLTMQAATTTAELDSLQKRFLEANPDDDAKLNVQFISLRLRSQNNANATTASNWLSFTRRSGDARSEAGIPLSNLALFQLLNGSSRFEEASWENFIQEILQKPSAITPELLRRAEMIAHSDDLKTALGNIEMLWRADERLREMAKAIQQTGAADADVITNLWISAGGTKWFCVINPTESIISTPEKQGSIYRTNQLVSARLFPESALQSAFKNAIAKSRVSVPRYFGFTVQLEGEPVHLLPVSQRTEPLATMTTFLSRPARMLRESQKASDDFESFPSHPNFTLSIVLADRPLLYSQHRQRTFWLLGLIACAAFASIVGFVLARRSFYQQLRLNELKSNFVSSVSHELRAPIASVRLLAESLERGKISEPRKQNDYFKFIVQECRRLSSLIENVLDFSRIEQGRKEYEFEPTDIVKLVRETVKLMEPYAAEKNVNLVLELNNSQLSTENSQPILDGHAIQQALVNLMDNAIKHSPGGAVVNIGLNVLPTSCRQKNETEAEQERISPDVKSHASELPTGCRQHVDGHVQISVEDFGPGIPSNEQEKIFERFYRLGSELRRETQGVGIGLSIVKHIVEAHGGKVSEVGKGSRFTMEIPSQNETSNIEI